MKILKKYKEKLCARLGDRGFRSSVHGQQTAMPLEDLTAQEGQPDPSQVGGESKTQHPNSEVAQSGGQACPTSISLFQQFA